MNRLLPGLVALCLTGPLCAPTARTENARSIVMVSAESDAPRELASVPLGQKTVFLKVDCDFKERADNADFAFSLDGRNWTRIGEPLHMIYTLPHFMGYRFALFNYATATAGGFVDFDFYRVSDRIAVTKQPLEKS